MPGQYHVQYDWTNCPIKCHPSFGVIKNRIQIKLELKPIQIGYYYKRLYILIAYHHPVYIDIYAFSGTMKMDPFSYFRSPFGPLPKSENNYTEFFKDVAHPRNDVQHLVTVLPKELRFGYVKNTKTLAFNVHNDSDTMLCINWIHEPCSDNPFTISPKQFYINSHDTKRLKCKFRPKIVPNIYFVEFEANVYFGVTDSLRPLDCYTTYDAFPKPTYIVPMNISLTVTGYSSEKPFNGWKSTCKLNNRVIVMPPTVPTSTPVFATLLIKKVVRVPTTFELRPPNKSMFLAKPMMGMIYSDYQIVVFQLMKTSNKESLYAERWSVVFDGFDNNSVSIDIYASAEFGCVKIGERNHVVVPYDVQVGCEMWDEHVPIVNTTRHRLRYCIEVSSQHHSVNNEVIEFLPTKRRNSWGSGIREEICGEEIDIEYENYYTKSEMDDESEMLDDGSEKNAESEIDGELNKYAKPKKNILPEKHDRSEKDTRPEYTEPEREAGPEEDDEISTMANQSYDEYSINSATMSVRKLERLSSMLRGDVDRFERTTSWPFVFAFDVLTGELGPNERRNLRLSFSPTECLTYTADAICYLTCDRNAYPEIFNVLPITIQGTGCKTRFQVTPENCNLNNVIINTETIQRFIIENKNRSYAKIKIVITPESSMIWPIPTCKMNPETFRFTPQQNQCKMDLSIYPTELGFQKFFVNIQFDPKVESYPENDITITVSMNVITCTLQILRISNDAVPYFGRLALNKLFHCIKINNELDKIYTKNTSPLIWTIPAISDSSTFDIQLYNFSKVPISWGIKYNECIKCTSKNKNNNNNNLKNCSALSNKCVHYKSIRMTPNVNLKMDNFSKIKIELNTISKEEINLSYKWSIGFYKSLLYNTELLIEPKTSKDGLISFDPKYGTTEQLEFKFLPIFIAHHNPPAQAFWIYNSNNFNVTYSIIDDSLTPAHPYFRCLNPSGVFNSKSVHPILFVFSPDRLCAFEATIMLLTNNYYRRKITLLGQGESYTRTTISPGHGLSSFLPIQNDRKVFLSTESIILKPMFTQSNIKSLFCLYNNSDEEIIYECKECTVDKILKAIICPIKGNLKKNRSQIFEISITSYNEPAILTIMLNISYMLVSQIENYERSLRNYKKNKDRLEGYFKIDEFGNYKSKLNMKIEKQPQEKHLVLYAYVRIIDEFSKWINEAKHNIKKHNFQQEKRIIKQKLVSSDNFQNILWDVVDKICSKEIENKPLYYYQLKNSKQNYLNDIPKTTRNNLEIILTSLIKDSLINIFPSNTWKH
ncbi:uncharacterized protein LOC113551681 [Rhopalosiphum maidis]|uniref:uncharacterized protein LOC113551681 n=1 Tax=Rhopalosiphum maidis TaxID=43146 RepID=UPI000EFFDB7A|nr:uncharacterized protein LOC113551681 [Rhopalosiphum maidis]